MISNVRVMISSPGDVAEEQAIASLVLSRIQMEYQNSLRVVPVLWDEEAGVRVRDEVDAYCPASQMDIVIYILWSRLGSCGADDTSQESFVETQVAEGVRGFQVTRRPYSFLYRKHAKRSLLTKDSRDARLQLDEWDQVGQFVRTMRESPVHLGWPVVENFHTATEFESLLERDIRQTIGRLKVVRSSDSVPNGSAWQLDSPFRGLAAYHREHAPIFFGRRQAISETLNALRLQMARGRCFLLIVGSAGVGKTSLARSGLIPLLTKPRVIEGVTLWRSAETHVGDFPGNPLLALSSALMGPGAVPELTEDYRDASDLAKAMQADPEMAVRRICRCLERIELPERFLADDSRANFALLIDPLEELLGNSKIALSAREAFLDVLDRLARSGRFWIIALLRSDEYVLCADSPKLMALKEGSGHYDLLAPTYDELLEIAVRSAQFAGLRFESNELSERIAKAAHAQPFGLTRMSLALDYLYDQRTDNVLQSESYDKLGGVERIVERACEEAYNSLTAAQRVAFPAVATTLVRLSDSATNRPRLRRVPLSRFSADKDQLEGIRRFAQARLIHQEETSSGVILVSLASRAILEFWPRLQSLLLEEAPVRKVVGRKSVTSETVRVRADVKELTTVLAPIAEPAEPVKPMPFEKGAPAAINEPAPRVPITEVASDSSSGESWPEMTESAPMLAPAVESPVRPPRRAGRWLTAASLIVAIAAGAWYFFSPSGHQIGPLASRAIETPTAVSPNAPSDASGPLPPADLRECVQRLIVNNLGELSADVKLTEANLVGDTVHLIGSATSLRAKSRTREALLQQRAEIETFLKLSPGQLLDIDAIGLRVEFKNLRVEGN